VAAEIRLMAALPFNTSETVAADTPTILAISFKLAALMTP
jgi:hypothetical protein